MIGFVPQNLKYDGHFHTVTVSLASKEKYTVQARAGFFAPKKGETPADAAKQEIEEAALSQEEQQRAARSIANSILQSGCDGCEARRHSLTWILGVSRFDKVDGRNLNDLHGRCRRLSLTAMEISSPPLKKLSR